MNTITLTEADGSVQTVTSTSSFTTITGIDSTGATITLFPVATGTSVADPIATAVITTVGGVVTTLVPQV